MAGKLKPSKSQLELQKDTAEITKQLETVSLDMTTKTERDETKKAKAKELQMMTLNLPKDQYEEYKRLFGGAGYSLAKGTRMCLDYINREIKAGNLELTESGLRETISYMISKRK